MTSRVPILLTLLCCVACEESAKRQSTDSTPVVVQTEAAPTAAVVEDPIFGMFQSPAPDSSIGAWGDEGNNFFSASHVRHPSGLLVMWLDTAIRATEDRPVMRAHADSIAVTGLQRGEELGRICLVNRSLNDRVVGILRDDTVATRPRLAWIFDTATFRIKTIPTDSVTCFVNPPVDEVD